MIKKFIIQMVLLLIVIFGALFYFHSVLQTLPPSQDTLNQTTLIINGIPLTVDVADTGALRQKGLGGRDTLASNSGMLFVFPQEGVQTFWMKGMKFPLDFIWIRNQKVVDVTKNVPILPTEQQNKNVTCGDIPCYNSSEPVTQVLEVNAGFIDGHGIKIGDPIQTVPSPTP
jgi:uncharacterized membrane protein (UPF0127 family)